MRRMVRLAAVATACYAPAAGAFDSLRLAFDPQFVLEQVARRLGVTLRPDVAPPAVFLESATPIAQFQDAIARQWGFRPRSFANAYAIARNEIYLIDNPWDYARLGRTIDESLAHELAHYVQVRYLNADLTAPLWEQDAIVVQDWFRTAHVHAERAALEQ